MRQLFNILIVFLAGFQQLQAETTFTNLINTPITNTSDTTKPFIRKSSFIALPLAFYTPETRFGGGAATLYAFRFRNQSDSSRPSQIQLGGAYTAEKQLLSYLPFQLFLKDAKYNIYGELGYYRYFFYFFGIGNDASDASETFNVNFPRARISALKLVAPNLYIGGRYWFDNYQIAKLEEGGLLGNGDITGSEGGLVSSLGAVATYDSRDNIFFAKEGILAELSVMNNSTALGSDFDFTRISLDASTYFTNKFDHTFAVNAYTSFIFGDAPFNELAMLGGTKKLRGFYEGRYRDKKLWMVQGEYRMPELYWRLGLVVFGGVGSVAEEFSDFKDNEVHYTFGSGLRVLLSEKERINIRIDVGIDEQFNILPYITVSEAF